MPRKYKRRKTRVTAVRRLWKKQQSAALINLEVWTLSITSKNNIFIHTKPERSHH